MNIKYLSFALLIYSSVSVAANVTVYRWIDENNIVHFSQHQPAHDNYIEITMAGNKKTKEQNVTANPLNESLPKSHELAAQQTSNELSEKKLNNDQTLCQTAKDNLKTLTEFGNIQYKDADGNTKVLSKLEKQQQITINTTQAEVYCIN